MVKLAHLHVTVEPFEFEAVHAGRYFDRVGRFGLSHGCGEQVENTDHGTGVQIVIEFGFETVTVLGHRAGHVVVRIRNLVDTACRTLPQCCWCAGDAGVVGEEPACVAAFIGCFDEQGQI